MKNVVSICIVRKEYSIESIIITKIILLRWINYQYGMA